jgi:hypothetical protein
VDFSSKHAARTDVAKNSLFPEVIEVWLLKLNFAAN